MSNSKKKKLAVAAAVCVLAGAVGTALMGMAPGGMGGGSRGGSGGGSGAADQAAQKTVVETETPILGNIVVTGSFVGTVEPGQQVTVYPKTSGEVVEANYGVGETVEAGAVLFRLDSASLQLDIAQSQANLKTSQAKAELGLQTAQQDLEDYTSNTENGLNSSLLQAEGKVRSAEIALQQANVDYRTARENYNDYINDEWEGDYSDSERDSLRNAKVSAELKVESAQLTLENEKANLEAVKKEVEEKTITAENSVKTAELNADLSAEYISLQKLQNSLSDYAVKAPISGTIEQKNLDVYDMASTQSAAYVISNRDSLSVSFHVAESALSHLQPGDVITLEKDSETCRGTITEVSTMVDSESGLYTVKASVEDAPFQLRSGSTVKLQAETQKVENEMIIPIDAVYYDNGSPYVFVFGDNAAHKAEVEVGISDANYIHVKSGLSLSDEVIVTWSASLYDGAEVYLPGTVPQESGPEQKEAIPDASENGSGPQESGDEASRAPHEEEAA